MGMTLHFWDDPTLWGFPYIGDYLTIGGLPYIRGITLYYEDDPTFWGLPYIRGITPIMGKLY